jgi:transcriptional regulator with XRE-family HTH domain
MFSGMTNRASSLQCKGDKIRQHRVGMNMTQEKLAAMSNTNVRTIQRAERGASVQMETIASIAAALTLTVNDIIQEPMLDEKGNELDEFNAVVLRPVTSGKVLMDMVCNSFSARLACNAEPTAENVDALSEFVDKLEGMLPNPWQVPMERFSLSLAERLRTAVSVSDHLARLADFGISVYVGAYTASAQVPHYDLDEGAMYTRIGQKVEPVTACRVLIDRSGLERVVEKVTDKWEPPQPRHADKLLGIDDDIPF